MVISASSVVQTFHDTAEHNFINLFINLANMYGVSTVCQNSIGVSCNNVQLK